MPWSQTPQQTANQPHLACAAATAGLRRPAECICSFGDLGCCPRSLLRPLLPGHTGGCCRCGLSISAHPRGQLHGPSGAFPSPGLSRNTPSSRTHSCRDTPSSGTCPLQDMPSVGHALHGTHPPAGHTPQPSSPPFPSAHCPPAYPSSAVTCWGCPPPRGPPHGGSKWEDGRRRCHFPAGCQL